MGQASDWLTWQVVDSAFPTGAFAHSLGLEAAWQQGEVADAGELREFLHASIAQAGHATLPLLTSAYRRPGDLAALDELADVFLVNAVANRASRVQGRTLAATVARVWPSEATFTVRTAARTTCAHVGPLSGAAFRAIGLPLETAQQVTLFAAARGVLAAAVRLGLAGSYDAQRMQHACIPWLEEVAQRCGTLTADDVAQTAPVADILQGGHDRLYSRLFQS